MSVDPGSLVGDEARELALSPPRAFAALGTGKIKQTAEDFRVDEILDDLPEEDGAHLWIRIEKRGLNTIDVAVGLAHRLKIAENEIGYCGLKDKHALTTQWFSAPVAAVVAAGIDSQIDARPDGLIDEIQLRESQDLRVLDLKRNRPKLQRGWHRANLFQIRVHTDIALSAIQQRVACLRTCGVPNYFGAQRFGRTASNLDAALSLASRIGQPRRRAVRGLYLSAARSLIFNAVLARRIMDDSWSRLLPGESVYVSRSGNFFTLDDPSRSESLDLLSGAAEQPISSVEERLERFELHPSGPLWGTGVPFTRGAVQRMEIEVARRHPGLKSLIEGMRMRHARRSLRVAVPGFSVIGGSPGVVECQFELEGGVYATTVLTQMFDLQ